MGLNESSSESQENVEQQETNDGEQPKQENTTSSGQEQSGDDEEEGEDEEEGSVEGSKTQNSFNEAAKGLTDRYSNNPVYVEIPESVDLPTFVADWTEVHDWIDEYRNNFLGKNEGDDYYNPYETVDKSYVEFRKQSQKEVNYLVKEFECRKSADAYARAGQSLSLIHI